MLDDYELFSQLCQKHGIFVEPEITEAIKTSCATGELRLGHISIIASLCEVIAQVLSSSATIKIVDLSDCMLLAKGLTSIFQALCKGSSVTSLYLKGNNISGSLVEQLGELLLCNNTVKTIHVEWNSLGSDVSSFAKFCEGLRKNNFIEELDLRYNQISTHCADFLSAALKSNKSLKTLDLSWNSLGLTGGQKILEGIRHNHGLILLNLTGNCVPVEIQADINNCIIRNQKQEILGRVPNHVKENIQPVISRKDDIPIQVKQQVQKKKKKRERPTTPPEELRDSPLGNSGNDYYCLEGNKGAKISTKNDFRSECLEKIEGLNTILMERQATIDSLKIDLVNKNEEFKIIKSENEQLKGEIQNLKDKCDNIIEEKTKEIQNMMKEQAKLENNWQESYKELQESNKNIQRLQKEAENKNRSYERELRKISWENKSLKEKMLTTVQNYEDTISEYKTEAHKIKREMQERENKCKIETVTLKNTLKETTEALEKCQEQLQKLRNELRESIENQAKLRIKCDEWERFAAKTAKIEDALLKSKEEKEKLEEKIQESRRTIASYQNQIIKLQEESMEPQKRCDALKLELNLEKEKSSNLKSELQDERMRIREQNDQLQKMLSQINGLYAQINEAQASHAEALRVKDNDIEKLKSIIAQKMRELDEFKTEQVQKAHLFQAAVNKYLGTFATNTAVT